jgi:uncharacterized membrane protein
MPTAQTVSLVLSDTARAETFSDGVLAIVITLLVLDLRPPTSEPGRLLSRLLEQWPTYLAYVASYVYVAVVWLNHTAAFRHIRYVDRGLHWANLGILFTTALLPFPTAVASNAMRVGNLADEQTAIALYALIGMLLCASWVVFFRYLHRHRELTKEHVGENFFARETVRASAGVFLYALAGAAGYLATPTVALAIFIGLPTFYGLTSHGLDALPLRRRGA